MAFQHRFKIWLTTKVDINFQNKIRHLGFAHKLSCIGHYALSSHEQEQCHQFYQKAAKRTIVQSEWHFASAFSFFKVEEEEDITFSFFLSFQFWYSLCCINQLRWLWLRKVYLPELYGMNDLLDLRYFIKKKRNFDFQWSS